MVFAGPSSPASTDSDTESVGKTGFCPLFPRMVFSGPFSPASTDSDTKSGGKEEKRVWKLGLNSDQLRRKAMRGPSASREALAKNPKIKQDALVGSENRKSLLAVSGSGTEEAPAMVKAGKVITPCLKMYTLAEPKSVTSNFSPDTMLGEGGFGRVFKGWVDERTLAPSKVGSGIAVAVKISKPESVQGLREWQSEVELLGKFSHPNLVRLLGHCWEDNHLLLVYEYMQRGSLENHLFRSNAEGAELLPWDVRLKIAIGAARGVDFLHTPENNVIYRDFKSSNILLDAGPVAGNSHVTTEVMGTYGYAAPEYIDTGHLYVKSDVYGFGVILLEMLTGLRVFDHTRPSGQQNLVEWARARPRLHDKRKLRKIMDPRLEGQYPLKAATQAAELILECLEGDPKARPSMDQVLVTLEHINTIGEKKETKASTSRASSWPSSHQHHHHQHPSPINQSHSADGPRGSGSQYSPSAASRTHEVEIQLIS
ncbi:hypothetical protein BT93_F2951 [Corymbia citriodora subsp. variegata]|nr:hypothetical protein BT93_F2951 [Corymbia citriodora subsp. variegata]